MKKIVLLLLLLLTLTIQGFAQNIQLDVDGDNLFYNEPSCDDCNGNPDPRWRVRFVINGGNFDWNNDRDEVCGWANQSNFGVHSPTAMGYSATVSTQMDGFESDGFTCGGDDNGCGGYGTMATRTASASPPCQWNFFYDSRGCGSGTYGLDWSFYWSYLFSPVISGETNTNQVRCNGVAPAVLSATVNTDANGRSLARWFRWQISNTPTGPWVDVTGANGSNTATSLSFTPGQISGTRYYRLQTTSNCSYDFGSYTATSAVYTVTYAFVSTGPYSNVSGYTYAAGDAAPAIQSSICGTTVLPAQTINFPLLLGANAGAAVNYTSLAWTASAGSPTTGSGTSLTWTAPTASGSYNINVTYNYAGCSSPATVTCAVTVGSPTCNFAYVAAGGSDVPTGGGPSNPYATIAYAITQLGTRTHIRLAGSTTESNVVNIPAGVTIEGGYTNTSGLWVKNNNTPSTITCNGFESVSGVCHRVGFKATTSNWSLIDLNITTSAVSGTDGSNRGCSNYGLWLNGASNYNVIRCNITSGAAANGANGVAGSNGANGGNGGGGLTDSCNDDDFLNGGGGGGGGVNAWGGNGGAGGRGGNAAGQSRRSRGCNGAAGATVGSAAGGAGGTSPGTPCQDNYASGNNNGDGTNDNAGAGNTGVPNHTPGVRAGATHTYGIYYTPSGQATVGGHGSGGGGGSGGGSSGGETCGLCNNNYGNSGGGGGGGGGGGQAGTGGYGGGSSFGVYRNTSSTGANFVNVTLAAGTLGNGGNGANGGSGGLRGEAGGGNGNCSGDRRTSAGGAPGRAGGSGGRGQDAANGVSATFVSDGTITAFTNSAAANTPVMTVPYNNTSFCQNSQVTITKASGTWVLPSGLSLVNLQASGTPGQALTDNNIVVTTTNTVASPTGFNFTSPATVGSFLIQSPTTRGVPAITVNASTTASICEGGSVTLAQTVTNGGTILNHDWRIFSNGGDARSPLAGLTSSLANPTISVSALTPGTYWVYYSQLEQCCGWSTPVYQSFTIVADPVAPTLNVATPASGTDVCVGGTVSATITAGSGGVGCTDDYRVSTNGGSTWAAYTSGASIVPTATGTVIIQGRRANSCGNGCDGTAVSYQQLATWTVLADPTSETAVSENTICFGSTANITASAAGGNGTISSVTFERATASITGPWTTVQTSSSATYSLPTSLAAGTYYYRATVTQTVTGCAAAADASPVTVVVLPTPTVGISGTTTVCQNASSPNITFTNSLANPITVSYTLNGVAQADINVAASSTATVAAITTSPGTFTYLVTNVKYQSAPTCDANPAVSAVVTVTPSTVAPTFTAGATSICANGTDTYTATTTQGTVTYSIIGGSGAIINSTTGLLTTAGTADFIVRATSSNGACSALSTDRAVTVVPIVSAVTASAAPNPICETNTLNLTGSATSATTWSWTGPNGFTSSLQSPSISSITTADAGIFYLTASNSCGSGGLSDNFADGNFTVNPPWTVQAGGFLSTTFLRGDNTAQTDRIVTPNTQAYGSWEFDYTFQTTAGGTAQVIRYFTSASSSTLNTTNGYYVYLDGSGALSLRRLDSGAVTTLISSTWSANTSAHTIQVTRSSANLFELFLDGVSRGTATDATYTATNFAGVWNTGSISSDNHTIDNIACTPYATTASVTVNQNPVAPTFSAGATTICANGTSTYTATTTVGTVTYSIIGGTGAAINSTTGALTSAGTADFTVRATATTPSCGTAITDRAVTVTPATVAPTFTAGATTICANGTDTYTATTTQGTVTYSIIGGTGAAINSTTGALTSAGTANFTVRATSTNGVCSSLFTDRVVTVRTTPTASVTVTGTNPVCQTGSSTVRFSGLNGTTITYNINGGSNTTTNITSGGFVDVGTGALSVTSTYTIVDAFYTDNSPGCTATPTGSAAVTVVTGPIQRTVTAPTTVCSGSSATVTLQSSESGTVYQLYSTTDNVNVGSTQTGNGGNLSFSTGALTNDNTYKIIASRNPCTSLDMNNGDDVSVYVVTNGSWKGSVSDNWFDGGNWCLGGGIPTSSTDITIPTGSITDFDPVIASNGAVSRTININSGGIMTISTNRNLDVWGTWNNSGNVNFNVSTVTFKGTGNVNLTGGIPQAFYNLRVDKGTTSTPIVDILDNTTVYGSLIPTNGRFQVSADLFIDNSLAVTTIASTAGIDVQGGNFRAAGLNITNNGLYNISSGTDSLNTLTNGSGSTYTHAGGISELTGNVTNTGATVTTAGGLINVAGNWSNASSSTVTYSGATIAIVGDYSSSASTVNANSATVSIGGRYTNSSSSTLSLGGAIVSVGGNYVSTGSSINQTGGAMTLNTTGASYNSNAILDIDASSNLNISSGTIYLQRANAGTGNDLVIAAGGTKTITGGTFQFGNASTPASQVFKVNNNAVDFNNFNVDNSSSNMPTVRLLANAATRSAGVLTVNGVLDLNGYTFNVKNGATTGIVAAGYVISETSGGTSKLAWNIGNNTGTYVYPFGTAAGENIPFTFDVTTAGAQSGAGNVTLSTYPTGDDNTPWVSGVQHMNFDQGPGSGTDATLDRWWIIDANNYTTRPRSNMTFKYASADLSGNSSILEDNLKAQRWNATGGPDSLGGWDLPTEYGIVSTANAADNTVTATGVSRYSPWVLHDGESSGNSPLPIELVDFKASCTNDVVTINWTTATEINNDYFTVQRSTDLVTYDNVAVVQGAGNSNTYRNYSAKDQYPLSGTSYYRLMQTDFNGDFEVFSPEAVACVTKDSDVISVFPNPAQDRLNVSMYLSSSDRGSIMIYNHYGQLVESMFVEPKAGVNTYNFDLGNLAQGQYFISFSMEAKVLPTQKVVITR